MQRINETPVSSARMLGATSLSARSRADGGTVGENVYHKLVCCFSLHMDVRGDYGLINV